MLYFAYGSNLNTSQIVRRCPSARLVDVADMNGYRFAYAGVSSSRGAGVATIIKDESSYVPGLIWSITIEDLKRLDRCEGAPFWYERKRLQVESWNHGMRRPWSYVLKQPLNTPTQEYHELISCAYLRLDFDLEILHSAFAEAERSVEINGAPEPRRRPVNMSEQMKRKPQPKSRPDTWMDWVKKFRWI